MKELSCGVIVTDGSKLLAIVPWGRKNSLSIPKGHVEPGEELVDCAIRELKEETSLIANPSKLLDLGRFEYTSYKDLHLFLWKRSLGDIDISQLRCSSYFISDTGKQVPEVIGFDIVSFDDPRFYRSLKPILFLIQKHL